MKHGERVKSIREDQGLSQEKFGNRLGVTKVAISNIENGNRSLTDQMIKGICREFNVNENWLRNEIGSMYIKIPENHKTELLVSSLLEPDKNKFYDIILEVIKGYQQLSPTSQQALNELADNILNNQKKQQHESEKMERNSATMLKEEFEECPRTPESMDQACTRENHKAI